MRTLPLLHTVLIERDNALFYDLWLFCTQQYTEIWRFHIPREIIHFLLSYYVTDFDPLWRILVSHFFVSCIYKVMIYMYHVFGIYVLYLLVIFQPIILYYKVWVYTAWKSWSSRGRNLFVGRVECSAARRTVDRGDTCPLT